ncbi:MAG: signal peptide peptidase SppA [Bacteroidales bacterium]|jgi:protease-4|nr:signal peptide peptidase SppA [Bacteroidales bacterium]
MKQFLKYLIVTISGTFLGLCAFVLLLVGAVAAIFTFGVEKSVSVEAHSVLLIRLQEPIVEVASFDVLAEVSPFSASSSTLALRSIVQAIEGAAADPNIDAIALYCDAIPASYATVAEIRQALLNFKQSGKDIVSYGDVLSQKGYALASTANTIAMNPEGLVEWNGIFSQFVSFKNLLAKIGLRPVVFRAGKYKSFAENLTQEKMSAENRLQIQEYVQQVWQNYTQTIENLRPAKQSLAGIADSLLVWNAHTALEYGMVDTLCYYNDFLQILAQKTGKKPTKIPFVSLADYIQYNETVEHKESPNKICVIVAEGDIVLGRSSRGNIGSETLARHIRAARNDSAVKAIVLRINSGGGSALASEVIWQEMNLARQAKPLIVSMGNAAASGAYYVAAPAHVIVANAATLTGSIGVFGVSLNTEELLRNIGVSVDSVKSSRFADFGVPTRTPSDYETRIIEKSIDNTYETFKSRVAAGRNMTAAQVEEIAQGRIWSGIAAQKIGLIDTLGGVQTAIRIAAERAQLGLNYELRFVPRQLSPIEQLMENFNTSTASALSKEIKEITGVQGTQLLHIWQQLPREQGLYMKLPYILNVE